MLFALVTFACIVCMVLLFRRCCLHGGRVHINPVFGMLLGVSFYILVPCIAIWLLTDLIDEWTVYGRQLSQDNALIVMAFTLALLVAFLLGTTLSRAIHPPKKDRHLPASSLLNRWTAGASWPAKLTMAASFLLFVALAFSIRGSLFSGYDANTLADDATYSARGSMSSAYSMFYVAMCVYLLRRRNAMGRGETWMVGLAFAGSSIILLSLGARLYVAMALLSLLALRSTLRNGIPARQLSMYLIGGAIAMGAVGVLRQGSLAGLTSVLRNIVLEPLLTSISLFTLLAENPPIWFGQPHMFIAEFQAVLPSFLFPGKAGLFQRIEEYGYAFEAPVGGYHLLFSGLINFGFVGMLALAVLVGAIFTRISRRAATGPIRSSTVVMAVYLSGAMTFTVFRDPFFIAIVKNVGIMAIVLPILLTPRVRRPVRPTPPEGER